VDTHSSRLSDSQDRRKIDRAAEGISRTYADALRAADGGAAERVALECLREEMSVETLYTRVITPAMWRIGQLWEEGAITVADEHLATALTHRVMASVYGSSLSRAAARPGTILLAAVEGDHHALGLRMAGDVLELAGYEVIYLGGDVPLDALVAAITSRQPDLVGLSSTLAPDRSSIQLAVSDLEAAFPDTPIVLGGQGVPDSILRENRTIHAHDVEGLVALVEGLLAESGDASAREGPRPAAQPDPPFVAASGVDSPEGRLLEAAADAADLARSHARMAHSYRRLAYEDSITKRPNRRAFDDRLALLNDSPDAAPVTMLMLDLDGFKQVNDTFGHAAGDRVLREVAEVVEKCHREGDFAARLGGDEFALLLPHTDISEAAEVAARVLAAISAAGTEASVTATIGIAPLDGDPRHTMLEADLALYGAKAAGRNQVGVADE
jgi:diguanylate cyclase (GGDEF)-like protein